MTRTEAITLLLQEIRSEDPDAYRDFMNDLAAELGYDDVVDAMEDALQDADLPVTPLH
jgi:hypothetical protein